MLYLHETYIVIGIYFLVALILSLIIIIASYALAKQQPDTEKISAYECGFSPFDDARNQFEIKYYIVSLLFIIFDLEVSLIFPWVSSLNTSSWVGFWSIFWFLFILTIGFVYEWIKGALEW